MKILAHAVIVGMIAAFAIFLSTQFQLQAWALFLAWVGYFVFGPNIRDASFAWLHTIIGLVLATILIASALALQPLYGDWALVGLVFFLATMLTFMEPLKPMNNIPAYYIGMIIVFASGLPPTVSTVFLLAIPTTIGFGLGWLTIFLRGRVAVWQNPTA